MSEWPRSWQREIRLSLLGYEVGLSFFRNPDAGINLSVDFIRGHTSYSSGWTQYTEILRFGPGQCGTYTWSRDNDLWCKRPRGHGGAHAYSVQEVLAA